MGIGRAGVVEGQRPRELKVLKNMVSITLFKNN